MSAQEQFNRSSSEIYKKISKHVPEIEWKVHAPLIEKINKLKKEKNAVILAHNYQTPEIYHGIFLVFDNCEQELQRSSLFLIY